MKIIDFVGTCSDPTIAKLAERYGRKSSYKNACRLIKEYDERIYKEMALDFYNPYKDDTNIKKINGVKYLHVVYSLIDFIFELN